MVCLREAANAASLFFYYCRDESTKKPPSSYYFLHAILIAKSAENIRPALSKKMKEVLATSLRYQKNISTGANFAIQTKIFLKIFGR
jgi:hypothetical protein